MPAKVICIRTDSGKFSIINSDIIVQFVVDRDGTISNPEVVRGVDPYLDKEAIRVISSMPKWTPGVQNGKKVRVKYTVPVSFRLQ